MTRYCAFKLFKAFLFCRLGNFALGFALVAPLLLGLTGAVIDFAVFERQKTQMQDVADSAALAAAKEAAVKNWSASAVQAMAESLVDTHLRGQSDGSTVNNATYLVSTTLDNEGKQIHVQIEMDDHQYFLLGYFRNNPQIVVNSSASVSGDTPVCVVGLEPSSNDAIKMTDTSSIAADKCAVYGNSAGSGAINVTSRAFMRTAFTCSTGGYAGALSSYFPKPTTDCPPLGDPLSARPAPGFGGCDHTKFVARSGTSKINPGVYCDGLLIDNEAHVEMAPGIYVIKGGVFRIRNDGSVNGPGVGIYFTGKDGRIVFDGTSIISLTAPENGDMAGLLMFQDRGMAIQDFEISSKKASMLLGTIYLPNGKLKIHAVNAIAEASAFTVIVSRYIDIAKKAKLYINSGYSSSNVPVPEGLGPNAKTRLTN